RALRRDAPAASDLPLRPARARAAAARRARLQPRRRGPRAGPRPDRSRRGANPRHRQPRPRALRSRGRPGAAPGGRWPAGGGVTPSRLAFATILAKDLRAELRTLQSLPAMALFATTTFVIFRFGLDRTSLSGSLAAGVLWA